MQPVVAKIVQVQKEGERQVKMNGKYKKMLDLESGG